MVVLHWGKLLSPYLILLGLHHLMPRPLGGVGFAAVSASISVSTSALRVCLRLRLRRAQD